jgi:hypothetical protein
VVVPPSSLDPGRLTPGTVIAGRYRVAGLIGRGGMGEVYRADDLKLGQPVALKFLPEELARDAKLLERFHEEVRLARSIAHPSVCRVYDIGEVDGQTFLSMEFVDGEDLASLLRRIGRVPREKALEIARRLCSGLAAVHERGVIHRDLKPANVMLDGRGEVRLTDFGLAGLAQAAHAGGIAGTPQYMAPEQLAGKGTSVQSDVYSLGLVLYELFTGRAVHRGKTVPELIEAHESGAFEPPSSVLADIDPAIESVLLRCLEKDPARRPQSALAVAAALPGGDPLAAALAAGETPSPQLVAAAGEGVGLAPARALALTVVVLAGLLGLAFAREHVSLQRLAPIVRPPAAMAERARTLLEELGVPAPGDDEHFGYRVDVTQMQYLERTAKGPGWWEVVASAKPSPVRFWYRRSGRSLVPREPLAMRVSISDPSPLEPGQVLVELDATGRLVELLRRPPESAVLPDPGPPPDWTPLLRRAGFEPSELEPAEPRIPLGYAQHLAAWTAPADPAATRLVAAGALGGSPLFLRAQQPWSEPERAAPSGGPQWAMVLTLAILLSFLIAAVVLAVRNLRAGRGDRRGALRVGTYVGALFFLGLALQSDYYAINEEVRRVGVLVGVSLSVGAIAWGLYLAVEPYVRRRWPQALIGWTRLVSGGWRDPQVGRDVLVGMLGGLLLAFPSVQYFTLWLEREPPLPVWTSLAYLERPLAAAGELIYLHMAGLINGLATLMIAFLLRALLRNTWLAGIVFVLALSSQTFALGQGLGYALLDGCLNGILFALLLRFGLLMLVALFSTAALVAGTNLAPSAPAFYSGAGWAALVLLALVALHACRASMAGRKLFSKPLLEV